MSATEQQGFIDDAGEAEKQDDHVEVWPFRYKPLRAAFALFWLGHWMRCRQAKRSTYDPREMLPALWLFALILYYWWTESGPTIALQRVRDRERRKYMTVEAGHLYEIEEEDNHDVLLIIGVRESRVLAMHLYDSLACTYFHVSAIKKMTRIEDVHEWFQRKRDVAGIKAREMVRTAGTNAAQMWAIKAGVWEALDRLAAALRSEDITLPEVTTLEDAIAHAENVAASCDVTRPACAAEHRRLANWLRELKTRRDADEAKEPRAT